MHFTSSEVVLKVEDSGCGIPPEQLEQVLQRFHRVESEMRREGAGIGLALTSELVKLHQGISLFHLFPRNILKYIPIFSSAVVTLRRQDLGQELIADAHAVRMEHVYGVHSPWTPPSTS